MSNLAYIEELGIGINPDNNDTEVESNDTIEEESKEDFVQDAEDDTSEDTKGDTEPNSELLESLKKQIEGMEKRLADKDDYINQLREASKQKEAEKQQEVDTDSIDEEESFWDDPEKIIKAQKEEIRQQKEQARIQQLQIAEIHYANTVDDYWKTVNPDALKEAVSSDSEFAKEFNNSKEPYKTAYEYLKQNSQKKADMKKAEEERIIREYLEKNGITEKQKKDAPPNINGGGKSSGSVKEAPTDGFAAVFGSKY